MHFNTTTHVIQTVWSGGVTRDGVTPITPGSSTALPRLLNVWLADGRALDDDAENFSFLGLADLGAEKDAPTDGTTMYQSDGDNVIDICLWVKDDAAVARLHAAEVEAPCESTPAGDTRLYPKKGLNFPCRRTRVKVNLAAGSAGKAACLMPDPLGAQPPAEGRSGRSR